MERRTNGAATAALLLALLLLVLNVGAARQRAEMRDRMDALLMERAGRDWDAIDLDTLRFLECRALLLADDWDAAGCVWEWDELDRLSRQQWGPDGDPETGVDE